MVIRDCRESATRTVRAAADATTEPPPTRHRNAPVPWTGVVCAWRITIHESRFTQSRRTAMARLGTGKHTYELVRDWPNMPRGEALGVVSRVVTDSQDRVYVFQRKDPPVVMFDRDGTYLGCWGIGAVKEAHGMKIVEDVVY